MVIFLQRVSKAQIEVHAKKCNDRNTGPHKDREIERGSLTLLPVSCHMDQGASLSAAGQSSCPPQPGLSDLYINTVVVLYILNQQL